MSALATIHPTFLVATNAVGHLWALEKCFENGANYPKGVAWVFKNYMNMYNPNAHVWALS